MTGAGEYTQHSKTRKTVRRIRGKRHIKNSNQNITPSIANPPSGGKATLRRTFHPINILSRI